MKYISNLTNDARLGALTMTNTQPTTQNALASAIRAGAGTVALGGGYTGGSSAVVTVEVLNNTLIGAPIISALAFSGVGNGALSTIAATSAVSAQKITVELIDVGTRNRKAWLPIYGVFLRARTPGTGGNAITLSVNQTGITRTATQYSLISAIADGTNEYAGAQWDFGAPMLQEDGTIPANAPRISFGNDAQIYRQYKTYKAGRFLYSFSPAPRAAYVAGTKVYAVAGTRTVTIADGITSNVYTAITSLYSILSAIKNDATITRLVEVDGPVLNDMGPDGMGMQEFDLQTVSYAASVKGEGTPFARESDIQYRAKAGAPTETVVIQCARADGNGSELWSVVGGVSGRLTNAFTGVAYDSTICQFTVPIQTPAVGGLGMITARPTWKTRAGDDPCFTFFRPILGARASDKAITFEYKKRPQPEDCCDPIQIKPRPNFECLGIEPLEAGVLSTEYADFKAAKTAQVTAWATLLVSLQRSPPFADSAGNSGVPFVIEDAVTGIRTASSLLLKSLDECLVIGAYLAPPVWVLSTVVAKYAMRAPTVGNGYLYQATTGGTTGGTQPTWPLTIGDTVTDNGVIWENIGRTVEGAFEVAFTQIKTEFAHINALGQFGSEWKPSAANALYATYPKTPNGRWYTALTPTTALPWASGASEPVWPTNGGTVVDGSYTWRDAGAFWTASQLVKKGESKSIPGVGLFVATQGGTTDTAMPVFSRLIDARYHGASGLELPRTVNDGSVIWTLLARAVVGAWNPTGVDAAATAKNKAEITAWIGSLGDVVQPIYAAARVANFKLSSGPSSDCWTDILNEQYHWVCISEHNYMPVFNNIGYHSASSLCNPDGGTSIEDNKEFYFAFQVCADQLLVGDKITVTIANTANIPTTYQVGDKINVEVIKSAPLKFENGQSGTDALTWNVLGAVTGPFAPYVLNLLTPNAYSSGGLSFAITEGAVPYKLGDIYSFWAEGGQFRWCLNAGAWTTAQIAPSVSISNGLTLAFKPGAAPSFFEKDLFTLAALAASGIDQSRTPDDASCAWVTSTNIDLVASGAVRFVGLFEHLIPQAATVRVQGSNDNFSTTPLNNVMTWRAGNMSWIAAGAVANYAKYRLAITGGSGSIGWIYAGTPCAPLLRAGVLELGSLQKSYRLPTARNSRALGVEITHEALGKTELNLLMDSLAHASEFNGGKLGLLPNDLEPDELILARIRGDEIDVTDAARNFQPRDISHRLQTVKLVFEPA